MALITCPECGKKISSKASFCVNCGCPAKEWKSDLTYAEIGDVIEFGSYFRTKYKQKLPIEWIVLNRQAVSNEASKLLLVSKYALDCKPYNKRDEGITWEESALRTWLNGDFYAASVCSDGSVSHLGDYVDYGGSAIRPAMWITHKA